MNRARPEIIFCILFLLALPVAAKDEPTIRAAEDKNTGQVVIAEDGRPVLQYNYRTVEPSEDFLKKVGQGNRKYARARSNYIHPLYGPDGEILTKDWSADHPHHRGIYWAWPEVDYNGQRGDLHALQRVFARPTGKIELTNRADFARIEAENLWKWEDEKPIVRESAVIRVYPSGEHGRLIDLKFTIAALADGVKLARRGTKNYGGLNIRLSPVADHKVVLHTDPAEQRPQRAWADSIGTRPGGKRPVGLAVFERSTNPHYPGQWIQYPRLPWFQPTFPAAGTRYELTKDRPLVLEYRLWIHGGRAATDDYAAQWRTFNPPGKSEPSTN